MVWDPKAHREKVEKLKAQELRRAKSYWPYFEKCDTCEALEGHPCWDLNSKNSIVGRQNPRQWHTIASAHKGRVKMSREEFEAREDKRTEEQIATYRRYIKSIQNRWF
jgi:hypothetical protein